MGAWDGFTNRRVVLTGGAALAGAAVLAACGGKKKKKKKVKTGGSGTTQSPTASASPSPAGLAKTSEIPVGGGKVFEKQQVVVTQPTAGVFKAFTAICTHQQCVVAKVEAGQIKCTCHGSAFSASDGSVRSKPATSPLKAKKVTVTGDTINVTD
jgi:Rieske Fe-S protein